MFGGGVVDNDVAARVRRTTAYRALRGSWTGRAILACSGGVDSSALLALAAIARDSGDVSPFAAAHVDHRVRPGSAADVEVVQALCERFSVPLHRLRLNDDGPRREDELREQRYDAIAGLAAAESCDCVVTAHTRDDQVETVLMRLISGSGGLAVAGMRPAQHLATTAGTVLIRRPLLDVGRAELERINMALGIQPIIDPTNADRAYRRNALRHEVIPLLRKIAPGFERSLVRSVQLAALDAEVIDAIASAYYVERVSATPDERTIDRRWLAAQHRAVASRVVRTAALDLIGGDCRELTYERIDAILAAVGGRSGAVIQLPYGVDAKIERDVVRLTRRDVSGDGA
jgi:tRNA(Ile)-lysidine synthase